MRSLRTLLAVIVIATGATISIVYPQTVQAHGGKHSVEVIPGVNTNSISPDEIIPGSDCDKIGKTIIHLDIKHFCVKSGSKLRWSKGVKITTPRPTPKYTGVFFFSEVEVTTF
jgi:hypothetical protein